MRGGLHQLQFSCPPRGTIRCARWSRQSLSPRGELFKGVRPLFSTDFQQKPGVLPPRGADGLRVALRSGKKLPGLQQRAADAVGMRGFGAQNLLSRSPLHVLPVLPKLSVHWLSGAGPSPAHGEAALFGDVRADDLVDDPPGHLHPPALKAPRLPVFQRNDGLGFNRAPEGVQR